MPELKRYRLFISHSWSYPDAYDRLTTLLREYPLFQWCDYSVPRNDPIHNAPNTRLLEKAIEEQMRPTNCILILAGVYSSYSKWIQREIQIANQLRKPIIAIEPRRAERTSVFVKEHADKIVKWSSDAIVNAIREWSI